MICYEGSCKQFCSALDFTLSGDKHGCHNWGRDVTIAWCASWAAAEECLGQPFYHTKEPIMQPDVISAQAMEPSTTTLKAFEFFFIV